MATAYKYFPNGEIDFSVLGAKNVDYFIPFEFEKIDSQGWVDYFSANYYTSFQIAIAYIIAIFGIKHFMRDRKPFSLKRELFWWNLVLGVYSICGFIRLFPVFISEIVQPEGFYKTVCVGASWSSIEDFWSMLFYWSKVVELGDTLFIVLRKKPLQFIQWFHHVGTMITVFCTTGYYEPVSRLWIVMNYGVHSLMYPYFAMKAVDINVPRKVAVVITTLQLSQMLMGLFGNIYTAYFFYIGAAGCFRHPTSLKISAILYSSFVILFGKLFYDSVLAKRKIKKI